MISLNWVKISLCLAMSVAKIHLIIPSRISLSTNSYKFDIWDISIIQSIYNYLYISLVVFSKTLHSGNSSSRKAIEQWWFSSGDMSLYLRIVNRWITESCGSINNIILTSKLVQFLHLSDKRCYSPDDPSHDKYKKRTEWRLPCPPNARLNLRATLKRTSIQGRNWEIDKTVFL